MSGRRPLRVGPGIATLLRRGVTVACPACGRRRLFRRWFTMAETCPRCGLRFERIEGHWIGAIGINTIVSFATLGVGVIALLIATHPDGSVTTAIGASVAIAVLAPTLFFPLSRTLWTAIDIAMRPLEAHEVDWTVVDPAAVAPDDDREPGNTPTAE